MNIPRIALILGLAGVLPFAGGALLIAFPQLFPAYADNYLAADLAGQAVMVGYGLVILSFMSGTLWGFAAKAEGAGPLPYILSVIPALFGFFFVAAHPFSLSGNISEAMFNLAIGMAALLGFDIAFQRMGLAPDWWLSLRLIITSLVLICFAVAFYG